MSDKKRFELWFLAVTGFLTLFAFFVLAYVTWTDPWPGWGF